MLQKESNLRFDGLLIQKTHRTGSNKIGTISSKKNNIVNIKVALNQTV